MGFDAAGNFSRAYNYTQDRDNGIKILASHVDGEFDNFATAMNLVFFRDGRVPMSADLRLNINGIQGLKDGALGSPAIKFNTDANTGPYLDGLSRYAIGVNAVQRGVFTTTGFDVTGALTATGNVSAGSAFFEGGTQLNVKYAQLASPALTGVPTAPTAAAGTNTTQLATTAFVQGILSNTTLSGTTKVGTLAIDGASGSTRTLFYFTAGAYSADISLQADNATIKHSATTAHRFDVNGSQQLLVNSGGVSAGQFNVTGATGAQTFAPHDASGGTAIIYSPTNKSLSFNDGAGSDILQYNGSGVSILSKSGAYYSATGAGNATYGGVGFSHTHAGQVGYHMYNAGGVAEWVIYQPASGTSSEFRIGQFAGAMTDRLKIDTAGNISLLGNVTSTSELVSNQAGSTGVVRFGGAAGVSPNYLFYDGTQFNLSKALSVGGNITSTSDARLKTNVRDLENGLALVKAMRARRFTMYGKADLGLVAQELEPLMPEVISRDSNGTLSVDYGRLVTPLIAAVQSLSDRLDRAGL